MGSGFPNEPANFCQWRKVLVMDSTESNQCSFGGLSSGCGVEVFQLRCDLLTLFPHDKIEAVSCNVNDAWLGSARIDVLKCLREATEPIDAGKEDVT